MAARVDRMHHLILFVLLLAPFGALAQTDPYPRPVQERIAEATLIVVGKLRNAVGFTKHSQGCDVEVQQVLFGSIPTNKTLTVCTKEACGFGPTSHMKSKMKTTSVFFLPKALSSVIIAHTSLLLSVSANTHNDCIFYSL